MKKFIALITLLVLLSSCNNGEEVVKKEVKAEVQNTNFIVGGKENSYLNIYGNILNNNSKTLTSNISGKVSYLACDSGTKVNKNTVVARIIPDTDSLSYKNNLVQINSLKGQLANLKQIKSTTILNFDSKYRQLELQGSELQNQLNTVNKTIGSDAQGVRNQLKIIEESLVLLEKNRASSIKNIDDSIINIRKSTFNNIESGLKRLDEVFGITEKNKDLNDKYDDFLGAKDTGKKDTIKNKIQLLINEFKNQDENLSLYTIDELSSKLDYISNIFKESADVIDNSISSVGSFEQTKIDSIYSAFLGISNGLITVKNNYDKLLNSRNTTILTFDTQKNGLESSKSQLLTQETTLNSNVVTLNNNSKNLKEQNLDLGNTKSSTIKEMDSNILSLEQAINQLNITFREDVIYAGTVGTIKTKNVNKNNNVGVGKQICTIVPDDNGLKLEIYSPNTLSIGMEFKYFKDGNYIGTGSIISESPVRNNLTQNYSYEANIDFDEYKEGDYLDIKVITQRDEDEIWVPLKYVFPKLDGYYVNLKTTDNIELKKVEVGKMNNGEIMIKSGLEYGNTLQQ